MTFEEFRAAWHAARPRRPRRPKHARLPPDPLPLDDNSARVDIIIRRMVEARSTGEFVTNRDIAAEVGLSVAAVNKRVSRMGLGDKRFASKGRRR